MSVGTRDNAGPREAAPRSVDDLDKLLDAWHRAQARGKSDQVMMARRIIPALDAALRGAFTAIETMRGASPAAPAKPKA